MGRSISSSLTAVVTSAPPIGTYSDVLKDGADYGKTKTAKLKTSYPELANKFPVNIGYESTLSNIGSSYATGIAYGNGTFVVVSGGTSSATALVNNNGVDWVTTQLPQDAYWSSVTYGNGLFVAVAGAGGTAYLGQNGTAVAYCATSPDGITWTQRTMPSSQYWISVAYGNGLYCAVAGYGGTTNNVVATSPDGITWTQRTLSASQAWSDIIYGGGLWVASGAVGANTNIVSTSTDGITWTTRTLPISSQWGQVAYGNGIFVITHKTLDSSAYATSPNGITWTQRSAPASIRGAIVFDNGLFIASSSATTWWFSTDGINWVQRTAPATGYFWKTAFGNGMFLSVFPNATGLCSTWYSKGILDEYTYLNGITDKYVRIV